MSQLVSSLKWRSGKLKDLVFFQRGYDITQAQQKPGVIPVISSSGVTSFHNEFKVNGPGVVIGRKGTLGAIHFTSDDYWPHDTTLWSKDFRGNDPRFVYYYLHTINFRRFDVGNSNPTLNRNHIHEISVAIPTICVQLSIVDILSAYDDLIENNRRRMALLEESARLLYREWFVRLRFPGYEHTRIVDGVPKGWELRTAFESMQVLSGGTPKTSESNYWDGEIPFYTPKDATDRVWVTDCERNVSEEGLKNCNSKLYPKGTVFISARGTVGKLNIAQRPMAMSQSCYALVGKDHLSQSFIFSAMRSAVDALRQQAVGAVFDAIVVDTFKRINLLVPPSSIINLFDGTVHPILEQIENLILQNQKLRAARDLLLPRLMSGEIAV